MQVLTDLKSPVGKDRLILTVSLQPGQCNATSPVGAVSNRAYGGGFPSLQSGNSAIDMQVLTDLKSPVGKDRLILTVSLQPGQRNPTVKIGRS